MSERPGIITAITTYNDDWVLKKTLDAVEKFSDLIIIYDDGSKDKTEEIARSYKKVRWYLRHKSDMSRRLEAEQRLQLIEIARGYNPEYLLLLDADEIPSPSIVPFLGKVHSLKAESWKIRVINLWFSEETYRVDSYKTKFNTQVNWNPFHKTIAPLVKCPLIKFDKNKHYLYDLNVDWGGCSRYHPAPENLEGEISLCDDFFILHYGWLKSDGRDNRIDKIIKFNISANPNETYSSRLDWHNAHSQEDNATFMPTKMEWFW